MVVARRLLATGTAAAGLALALPVLPAAAAPDATGRAFLEVTEVDETTLVEDFCGTGETVEVHEVVTDRSFFTFHGRDALPYFHGNTHERTTFTEVDTGTTVRLNANTVNKDQQVVDNGDGTFTITAFGAGGFMLTGPDGKVRNPGRLVVRFDVDTNGTPQDPRDDVEIEGTFETITESTGLNEGTGDLCGDYLLVTGRAG